MNSLRLSILTSCALLALPAYAQDAAHIEASARKPQANAPAATARKSFTTGVAKGRDLLDTAISASTLDETEVQKIGTRSIAEILSNIPGLRAETAGTDGLTALTIRGLPLAADGSKFLQIQEDGLPVMEFGDIHFAATTAFLRTDLSLSQVQAIRGGSASTFASNSPGGIVNFLSKTGEEEGGTLQLSSGIDHGLGRADFNYGAHLSKSVRFNLGGYYRQGEGPRSAGYDAFKGGQIKFNITKTFGDGYVRLYAKYLDDREPNYAMMPMRVSGTEANPVYTTLPGFDARSDTLNSRYRGATLKLDSNNNISQADLHEGNRSKAASLGFETQFDLGGWTLTDRMRYAKLSGSYNEELPTAFFPAAVFPVAFGGPGATLRYASGPNTGKTITDLANLNGNGLMSFAFDINADLSSLNNFTNDLRATRVWKAGDGKLTSTFGLYASSQDVDITYFFNTSAMDFAGGGNGHFIDVVTADGKSVTQNGIMNYSLLGSGSYRRRLNLTYRTIAPYASVNYQIGRLAIGASLRYDSGKVSGSLFGSELGGGRVDVAPVDMNRDGVLSPPEQTVAVLPSQAGPADYSYHYFSYSAGVNYRMAESLALFARYSRGARANAERIFFSPNANPVTGGLNDPSAAYAPVKQAEGGAKFRTGGLSLYLTGFWASVKDNNLQIASDATGAAIPIMINRSYSAKGVEFEGLVEHGPLSLRIGATYTKARIDSDKSDATKVGKTPRRQPDLIFQAMPQYQTRLFSIGTNLLGTTSSYAQDDNILKQPGYVIVSPFAQVRPVERLTLGVNVYNVFNKLALVQVGSAAIPAGGVVPAQVLNGRTITGSVRFTF